MRPGPYFRWLKLPHCGGVTGVFIAAGSQAGAHTLERPSFGMIRIQLHRAEVCLEPCLAVVETVRMMITNSGKS